MGIAYLIMIHKNADQFQRLFNAIYDVRNHYLVHVDEKSEADFHDAVRAFVEPYPNAYILPSIRCIWGGYSIVDVELQGIRELLNISGDWDFFINLSGQDFPLKSQDYILNYLDDKKNCNFIDAANQITEEPKKLYRVEIKFYEGKYNVFRKRGARKRSFLENVTPYTGAQWFILNRAFCDYLVTSDEINMYESFYRNTFCPDEGFFQTIIMNSSFKDTVTGDYKREIVWRGGKHPKILTMEDHDLLLNSEAFFTRKFDTAVDNSILDVLEQHIKARYMEVDQEG